MKVTVKEVSEIQRELAVTVPVEDVQEEMEATYRRIGQKARLKGFRPGKVPRSVLEQNFREDAESEAMRNLVSASYPLALRETGLEPVASPQITVTAFGPLQEMGYQVSFEIRPKFVVKGYQGLKLKGDKTEATSEEIQQNLVSLQERAAQLIPVTEVRGARAGDVIVIDYQGFSQGKKIMGFEAKDYVTELGRGLLFPELESDLPGTKPAEKKTIQITLPDQWPDKNLAGQKVDLEVELKSLKEKKLPELNDDFAKDLGSFTTLEDVRKKIQENIHHQKEQAAKSKLRRQVIEKLIKENEFPVPQGMIQSELEAMWHQMEDYLKNQNMTVEQAGLNREDFLKKNEDEAGFRVRGALLFDAVAHQETLTVSPEEIDTRIVEMARLSGQSEESWKQYYREKNMLPYLEGVILEEKVLDFVLSKSTIKVE